MFPPRCVFCERTLEPNQSLRICGKCGVKIELCSDSVCCEKCGKPILGFGERQLCYFCTNKKTKYVDRIVSAFVYEGNVKKAVVRFKTKGFRGYSDVFASCVAARVFEEYSGIKFDFICGAPPHNKRRNRFDQVEILCKRLVEQLDIPYEPNLFVQVHKTSKQSELGFFERLENMKGSLKVRCDAQVDGKAVLLIDDVCTTRATIIECARALKSAGARRVCAATIATVVHNKKI